ncbi:MAG TPA: hypothetical protein VEW04_11110 [Allosphingosinicella sp.]|nr:hypothetical protein [Allosphingosinicella sp.]
MAENERWVQDALDSWLSPEPGTGPAGDEAWREKTGYFHSAWRPGQEAPPPAAAQEAGAAAPAGEYDSLAARYEADRAGLRTAMTGFTNRLLYAFPNVAAMSIADIAAAGGWIADMERRVLEIALWAVMHKGQGRPELSREVDGALAELAQLKQAYALQRGRIEQSQQAEVQRINRDTETFVREQEERRRRQAQDTDDYIEELRRKTEKEQEEARDRQYREFLRYIRGSRRSGSRSRPERQE